MRLLRAEEARLVDSVSTSRGFNTEDILNKNKI